MARGNRDGELARNVQRLRNARGLTQEGLALASNSSRSYVADLENGRLTNPGVFTLYPIALALRVPMEELMGVSLLTSRDRIRRRD